MAPTDVATGGRRRRPSDNIAIDLDTMIADDEFRGGIAATHRAAEFIAR